jgi:hypothetical protein
MIDPNTFDELSSEIQRSIEGERALLEELLTDVRQLKANTRRIQSRSATAISLVGTDGGNNRVSFDPFLIQIIRVVDSSDNEYCLETISVTADFATLNARHIDSTGKGLTALGRMAQILGISKLEDLSPVFSSKPEERSPSWIQVYREMTEWAVLLELVRFKDFGSDTVIVRDGFLRSKMFKQGLFGKYQDELETAITNQFRRSRRRIYVVGIAKHSKVLQKYRLAMAIEGVLRMTYPAYVAVPEKLEAKVYKWSEYATGGGSGEVYVAGKMFLAKFGNSPYTPPWAVDLFKSQAIEAATIFGYLLADCSDGFPVPCYPQCLQKAHEKAALVDFDLAVLQDQICAVLRKILGAKGLLIDELALQENDPSAVRYD